MTALGNVDDMFSCSFFEWQKQCCHSWLTSEIAVLEVSADMASKYIQDSKETIFYPFCSPRIDQIFLMYALIATSLDFPTLHSLQLVKLFLCTIIWLITASVTMVLVPRRKGPNQFFNLMPRLHQCLAHDRNSLQATGYMIEHCWSFNIL